MAQQDASPDIPLRLVLIGTLIASVLHGLVASTFLHCLPLLIANKKRAYTNRARWFLVVYIVTMFLLSAVAALQAFVYVVKAVIGELEPTSFTPLRTNAPITPPLAIWGADGVMVCQSIQVRFDSLKSVSPLLFSSCGAVLCSLQTNPIFIAQY